MMLTGDLYAPLKEGFNGEANDTDARCYVIPHHRSGFYEVQHSRKDVFDILGEPNVPTVDAGLECDTRDTVGEGEGN